MNISRIRDLVSLFALMTMLFCACGNPNGKGSQFPTPSSTANQSIPTPSSVTNQSFPLSITLTNCIDQWTILRYELLTQEEFNGQIKYPLQGSSFLRIYMDPSSTNPGNLIDLWKGNEVFITDGQEDKYLSTAILTSTSNDDLFIEFQSIPNDRQNFIYMVKHRLEI
jgi:hypothetical protein